MIGLMLLEKTCTRELNSPGPGQYRITFSCGQIVNIGGAPHDNSWLIRLLDDITLHSHNIRMIRG